MPKKLSFFCLPQCLHQVISQTYLNSKNIIQRMLDTRNVHCCLKSDVKTNININIHIQALTSTLSSQALRLLMLKQSQAFIRNTAINLFELTTLIIIKNLLLLMPKNYGCVSKYFSSPHCSQVTAHSSNLVSHPSLLT